MFSGFKKRVSSALQEGRGQLSEALAGTSVFGIRQPPVGSSAATSPMVATAAAAAGARPPFGGDGASAAAAAAASPHLAGASIGASATSAWTNGGDSGFPYGLLNANAGCRLLGDAERDWQQMHEAAERNAAVAEQLDRDILLLRDNSNRTLVTCSDMVHSLLGVPALCAQLSECGRQLADVRRLCELVEESLFQLEDVIEECELHGKKLEMRVELAAYQSKKMADMDLVRVEMEREHSARRQQHEQRLRNVQQERQAVFQAAFQDDLRTYRQSGAIPRVDRQVSPPTAALEEIVLDAAVDDRQRLDEFLNN